MKEHYSLKVKQQWQGDLNTGIHGTMGGMQQSKRFGRAQHIHYAKMLGIKVWAS